MKLPNGERAIVDDKKLLDYCLSPTHARGRHKARLFAAATGLTRHHLILLRRKLMDAARTGDAVATRRNAFGQLYKIEFSCTGPSGTAKVLSAWVILDADLEKIPRLVTCYPV
jgi:hypothetical protein